MSSDNAGGIRQGSGLPVLSRHAHSAHPDSPYSRNTEKATSGGSNETSTNAARMPIMKTKGTRKHRYDAGVVLDLCTGKDAKLKVELNSYEFAPSLVDQLATSRHRPAFVLRTVPSDWSVQRWFA